MYVGCSDLFSVRFADSGFRFNCDNTEIEFLAHKIAACEFFLKIGLVIDFQKRLITRDGAEIHLTQNEFKIVSLLAQNCGQVLTYDRLIVHVWGPYSENDTTSLRVHMANIRRKLEPNPSEPMYIFTEIGVGYRMVDEDET